MRHLVTGVLLGLLSLSLTGCIPEAFRKNSRPGEVRFPAGTPRPDQLVSYLNQNARRVPVLETVGREGLYIDAKQEGQAAVNLSGTLVCQKGATPGTPPNFRMQAHLFGKNEVDLGSNSQEFWYWIARAPENARYVFHCSYADFRSGKAQMPFPFHPEWIVEAMGIGEYDPNGNYWVRENKRYYDLIEQTTSPQGQPVHKVTVFNRGEATGRAPQVVGRVLTDAAGKEICSAWVQEVQVDPSSGAVLPRVLKLRWPQEKTELTLTLKEIRVSRDIDKSRAASLFSRESLNLPGYDLAQRRPDSPTGLKQAGGFYR